jgi:MFS family permease
MLSPWKDPPFTIFTIGLALAFTGFYFPVFYIQSYAISKHITNENLAFYLLSILNAASLFGRIIPNWLADRWGPLNVIAPATIATAILVFAWMGIHNTPGLIIFAILYGFFSGCFVSVSPTVIVTLTANMREIGTRVGMSFACAGIGSLVGSPVGGYLVKKYGFNAGISFGATTVSIGAALMVAARIAKNGYRLKVVA